MAILYSVNFSCLVIGHHSHEWRGYLCTDTYFEEPGLANSDTPPKYAEKRCGTAKPDPFTMGATLSDHMGRPDARLCFLETMPVRLRRVQLEWGRVVKHLELAATRFSPAHERVTDLHTFENVRAYGEALERDYAWSTKATDLAATLIETLHAYRDASLSFAESIGRIFDTQPGQSVGPDRSTLLRHEELADRDRTSPNHLTVDENGAVTQASAGAPEACEDNDGPPSGQRKQPARRDPAQRHEDHDHHGRAGDNDDIFHAPHLAGGGAAKHIRRLPSP
ncbi:uncharacterized protein B0I36DRAFT_127684 [Microdochium trichocladiopsis]|uniref:Uncharacterized protein n=1 Tax=Microdochium trichocladiopsis TaxID=1682393 RepID=A0A9P8Y6L7_9PEZI|nr:uncharacterized protein B0I36DRAFT_127684 [Microdochium trichocladiopsis]KAH7029032.1 hypothetical protein B0I36DRAFT_127684 [Microdochium trichocladiopsis]